MTDPKVPEFEEFVGKKLIVTVLVHINEIACTDEDHPPHSWPASDKHECKVVVLEAVKVVPGKGLCVCGTDPKNLLNYEVIIPFYHRPTARMYEEIVQISCEGKTVFSAEHISG